ncbi:MAG: ATP-binding cassette domain-containing protein [Gammaproteobacteria bacterium]|nr:ATP-binding cassette domain-containing protein [Gammaproteobacteria bacterium]
MIEVQALSKSFGDVKAVRSVSFQARDGAITGLLGPNGAGKSTTLRMLYTILQADSGSALIDGIDVAKEPLRARGRIGVFTHNPGIYPNLTAYENIVYFGKLYQLDKNTLTKRIDYLVDLLEMNRFIDRRAKGFSQGQRTKVALARALIHEPHNILLDEPTNGLDVMATRSLRDIIRRLKTDGKCVLFSSHIMQEVAALCDEVVIIRAGEIAASGAPQTLRERTNSKTLEEAFVKAIGNAEGLM